jgi:PAS domain-containing protein
MAEEVNQDLRRTLTGFAGIIAFAIVLVVAAEYFITAYRYESDRIQATSDSAAATLSRMIYRAPDTWLYQEARVTELLSEFVISRHAARGERHVRVIGMGGDLLFQLGSPPPVPALTRVSELTDGFETAGRIEITENILHVWERTAIATMIGLILALAMSVVLRTLPLRALMNREEALIEANQSALASERVAVTANTRLTEAIEALNDAFVLYDSDDRLELCNTKYREFYKALPEFTTAGTRYEDLLRAGVERDLFPEAAGREEEWLAEQMAEHRAPSGQEKEVMLNGRWLGISEWRTQNGGTVSVRTDITARKLAELALRASEEQLLLVTDAMPALIGYVDSGERFRFVNGLFEKWFIPGSASASSTGFSKNGSKGPGKISSVSRCRTCCPPNTMPRWFPACGRPCRGGKPPPKPPSIIPMASRGR